MAEKLIRITLEKASERWEANACVMLPHDTPCRRLAQVNLCITWSYGLLGAMQDLTHQGEIYYHDKWVPFKYGPQDESYGFRARFTWPGPIPKDLERELNWAIEHVIHESTVDHALVKLGVDREGLGVKWI